MAASTDAQYNAISRSVLLKLDMYIDGSDSVPLQITRDNYLISCNLLEEATSGDTLFSSVAANECTFELLSEHGLFNPSNVASEYYGKMKLGILVKPYFRASYDDDWEQCGEYFVTEWNADVTASIAKITASDKLYRVMNADDVSYRPARQQAMSTFITQLFEPFQIVPVVDDTLVSIIPIAYAIEDNAALFEALGQAYLLIFNVRHDGNLAIINASAQRTVRAVLSDADQVAEIDATMSADTLFDSAVLTYYKHSISDNVELASKTISEKQSTYDFEWSSKHLWCITAISVFSSTEARYVANIVTCNNKHVEIALSSPWTDEVKDVRVEVLGQTIETESVTKGTAEDNCLKVDTVYVQTDEHASWLHDIMMQYASNELPTLKATIRGNPKFELGDKLTVQSEHYGVDFTGVLIRQQLRYDGGLACDITLLNSRLLEVII